jgi:transposase-like protein
VEFQTLGRYQRRQLEIDKILGQLFLAGISTRRLRRLSEELYGRQVSATTISKMTSHLAEELEQYRTAPIADEEVEFLFLDGIHRAGAGARSGAENPALRAGHDGRREETDPGLSPSGR